MVPRLKFCFLPEKASNSETGRSQGHVPKGLQEYLYMTHCNTSWQCVSHNIYFLNWECLQQTEEDPDKSEPAGEGETRISYYSD